MRDRGPLLLSELTTLRLGGPARQVLEVEDAAELVAAVVHADARAEPVLVVGGGSNLVVSDDGFAGTVVLVRSGGVDARDDGAGGVRLAVAAGEDWDAVVALSVERGWAGLEALSGIPGTCGASPIQNVGAYGQEVSTTCVQVKAYDRLERRRVELSGAQCDFGYRTSRFKRDPHRFVLLEVVFGLRRDGRSDPVGYAELAGALGVAVGDRADLRAVREAVLELRRGKGMVLDPADTDTWSVGSFFTNPVLDAHAAARLPAAAPRWPQPDGRVKTSAAWLLEQAGFGKGYGRGRAGLSAKHPLALTNRGGATTAELLDLAGQVRSGVRERFGVELEHEPVIVGCPR